MVVVLIMLLQLGTTDTGPQSGQGNGFLKIKIRGGESVMIGDDIEIGNEFDRPTAHVVIKAPRNLKVIRIGPREDTRTHERRHRGY